MKRKVVTDLSKLSNVPEEYLSKLLNLCGYIIGNAVYESNLASNNVTELDFEFGTLLVKADLKEVKLKLIPNTDLQADLKNINQGGTPSLKSKLERSVASKLIEMYKDII